MASRDPEAARAYAREYRKKNRERINAYHREWRKKRGRTDEDRERERTRYREDQEHRERMQAAWRKWRRESGYYEKNKEKIKEWHAAHRPSPEKRREYQERYYARDPQRVRELKRKNLQTYRARIRGAFIEAVETRAVLERSMGLCGICGLAIEDRFEIDHIVPVALGGKHGYDNVQAAHPECNRRKGGRLQ